MAPRDMQRSVHAMRHTRTHAHTGAHTRRTRERVVALELLGLDHVHADHALLPPGQALNLQRRVGVVWGGVSCGVVWCGVAWCGGCGRARCGAACRVAWRGVVGRGVVGVGVRGVGRRVVWRGVVWWGVVSRAGVEAQLERCAPASPRARAAPTARQRAARHSTAHHGAAHSTQRSSTQHTAHSTAPCVAHLQVDGGVLLGEHQAVPAQDGHLAWGRMCVCVFVGGGGCVACVASERGHTQQQYSGVRGCARTRGDRAAAQSAHPASPPARQPASPPARQPASPPARQPASPPAS
jgi:hypothetical protein